MMVTGIGVDIVKIDQLVESYMAFDDPFGKRTFSSWEHNQANLSDHRLMYYATRFAAKEAVFKALSWGNETISFCEIEIGNEENGQPVVTLSGKVKAYAQSKGINKVLVSLSHDTERAIAFAIAQTGNYEC